jgi:AAA+ superfamily predicted ATPase
MLATQSEGMSGRDIKNWIIKAQKHAAHLAVEGEARQRMS